MSERIVLDVAEDFPGGWPRAGDVVVVRPEDTEWPVALIRYQGPELLAHLRQYREHLRCRDHSGWGCPGCQLLDVRPEHLQLIP